MFTRAIVPDGLMTMVEDQVEVQFGVNRFGASRTVGRRCKRPTPTMRTSPGLMEFISHHARGAPEPVPLQTMTPPHNYTPIRLHNMVLRTETK